MKKRFAEFQQSAFYLEARFVAKAIFSMALSAIVLGALIALAVSAEP